MAVPANLRHLEWFVAMAPTPQQRHRHTRCGNRTYDPCAQPKAAFRRTSYELCPVTRVEQGALRMHLIFLFKRPKSHLKRSGGLRKGVSARHIRTPDTDNLAKFVMDSLNGTYYKDDAQIVDLHVQKMYAEPGQPEGVRVVMDTLPAL